MLEGQETISAIRIQAAIRGFLTRRKVEKVSDMQVWLLREKALLDRFLMKIEGNMHDLLLNAGLSVQLAATCIQKCYRGHKIRLKFRALFAELREKKAETELWAFRLYFEDY